MTHRYSKDQIFSFRLPPGQYQILSILPKEYSEQVVEPTPLKFSVPDIGKAYFIGTLIVDWEVMKNKLVGIKEIEIKDNMDEITKILIKEDVFWVDKVERNLMRFSEPANSKDLNIIDREESLFKSMKTVYERYPLFLSPPLPTW